MSTKRERRRTARRPERREPCGGGGQGLGVPVQAEDGQVGVGVEERGGVASPADGGVDDDAGRHRGEQRRHLFDHYRLVVELLGHPQPPDRRRCSGGGPAATGGEEAEEWSSTVAGRGAAQGPEVARAASGIAVVGAPV